MLGSKSTHTECGQVRSPSKEHELYICDLGSLNEHVIVKFRELIDYLKGKKRNDNPSRVNKKCFEKITTEN